MSLNLRLSDVSSWLDSGYAFLETGINTREVILSSQCIMLGYIMLTCLTTGDVNF